MATHESKAQKATVERVMHEFKEGELRTRGSGPKVKNPKQAIAIAHSEAGASNQQSAKENKERLKKTRSEEKKGETAEAEKEGKAAQSRTLAKGRGETRSSSGGTGKSKSELYAEARKRNIPGRSQMSKPQLERAIG